MTAARESSSRRPDRLGVAVAAAAAMLAFLAAWALLHEGFYARDEIVDTPVYQRYGDAIERGAVPYRDFEVEYPPLALPVFAVPSLTDAAVPSDGRRYRSAFEALMVAAGLAVVAGVAIALAAVGASPARRWAAIGFVALAPLALGSMVLTRFDLWPAALTAAALAAWLSLRERLAAPLLGLAIAAKLYPAVLLPLLAVWTWRRRGARAAVGAVALAGAAALACYLPFALVAPGGVADSLARQLSRPLQVESLGAAALLAAHHAGGLALGVESSHGSQNLTGGAATAAAVAATVLQAAALLAIWVAFARGPMERERLVRFAVAAVSAFVALGKVLSPQFLIWLVPLVPLVRGRRGLASSSLLALALVLTQLWFPYRYWELARDLDGGVAALVLARDAVLVALLAVLVAPAPRATGREPGPARTTARGRPGRS